MKNIIKTENLSKRYGDFKLDSISMVLPQGAVMGLIGENGAGKTTLIRLLTNLCIRDGGMIEICSMDNIACERTIKQEVGIVYDSNYFCEEWKIRTCEKAVKPFFARWDSAVFSGYLKRFDLDPNKRVKTLSRGMKMKLMLATALSHDAKLLILDEPTSGLDPVVRDELLDVLQEFISGAQNGVLFSTHITSDREKIATHVTFIQGGKMVFTGKKQEMLSRYVGVRGELSDSAKHERLFIGKRTVGDRYEAMVLEENSEQFDKENLFDLNIEQVMLFVRKGEDNETAS